MTYELWEKRIIGTIGCYELFEEGYANKPKQTYPEELKGKDHKPICSNQTLYRIGKGQIISSDKVYDELPHLLDVPILPTKQLYEILSLKLDDLLEQIFMDNKHNVKEIYVELINEIQRNPKPSKISEISDQLSQKPKLRPKSSYFGYYCEMAIQDVMNSYLNDCYFTSRSFNRYSKLMNCFPDSLQVLLKHHLFRYAAYRKSNIEMVNQVVTNFEFANSSADVLKIDYALNLKYQNDILSSYNVFGDLEMKYQNTSNYGKYIEILNLKANVANIIRKNEVIVLENKMMKIMELHPNVLSEKKTLNLLYIMGMRRFSNKKYKEALLCLEKTITASAFGRMKECQVFLAYLYGKVYQREFLQFNPSLPLEGDEMVDIAYRYYMIKLIRDKGAKLNGEKPKKMQKEIALELNEVIMHQILPSCKSGDNFYIHIFGDELRDIVKITRNYKDLAIYYEKTKKFSRSIN